MLQDQDTSVILPSTQQECTRALQRAKQVVKAIVKESFAHREAERDETITRLEQSRHPPDKTQANFLRSLKRAEATKQVNQKIKHLQVKGNQRGLTLLEIPLNPKDDPRECEEWKTIEISSEILEKMQARSQMHFGQAYGTPFTVTALIEALGFSGDSADAEDILNGTFDFEDLTDTGNPQHTRELIQLLQPLVQTGAIRKAEDRPTILKSEFTGKLKAWRESTVTSPWGIHLGHYKAMVSNHLHSHLPENNPNRRYLDNIQDDLIDLHLSMINYALEKGYSFI